MVGIVQGEYSLQDLGMAYRKAKADAYYSSQVSLTAIADYEEKLKSKLTLLLEQINSTNHSWINEDSFLGSWTLIPKSIEPYHKKANELNFSSPADAWNYRCKLDVPPKAEFRLMADVSMDFQVLSALWIHKVGHKYDELLSACAYGNRLRRTDHGEINSLSLGSFKPYPKPFRDWRDNGITAMRSALVGGKKIVALTADIRSFYHELNPSFMMDENFNEMLGIELSPQEKNLHQIFITALVAWAAKTPIKNGLPVGLPASAIVANLALIEFDRLVEQQLVPLYYGRYVDDIILVMENGAGFSSTNEIWEWIFSRSDKKMFRVDQENIQYRPDYLKNSNIQFGNEKNKVFSLHGDTGITLVDVIAKQIHERASEWRALPSLPELADQISTDLVAATQYDGEDADNLRKTDLLTMRRAGFAIKLRDFEAYERDLHPDDWVAHRHAFFKAFIQHVLVLPQFFELYIYLSRVLRLATACEDFEYLFLMLRGLEEIKKSLEKNCQLSIKCCSSGKVSDSQIVEIWGKQLHRTIIESIIAAFPPRLSAKGKLAWELHMADYSPDLHFFSMLSWPISIDGFQSLQEKYFNHDLAHMPFRFIFLPKEIVSQRGIPVLKSITFMENIEGLLSNSIVVGVSELNSWVKLKGGFPFGFLFSVRPFGLTELFFLHKSPFVKSSQSFMNSVVYALRGFSLNEKMPILDKNNVLQIPNGQSKPKRSIAVASWKTEENCWLASVMRERVSQRERYQRLFILINNLISCPKNVDYLVLPELALPARWFIRVADKLQTRGISLITGIEYLHLKKGQLCNQVWASFTHSGLGVPSIMIYRQDKQRPALHEEQELKRLNNSVLKPSHQWIAPPILQHGEFRFALLVCSELTNINYRAALRGEIDALFVPEWNKDTETFNSLVESTALDIHAYIIQCNDRQYGDSRIRAPAKENWERDILRVKGGVTDYCVIGEIDIDALREFQSSHRSPSKPFKPTPDGFKINHYRRKLPVGEG